MAHPPGEVEKQYVVVEENRSLDKHSEKVVAAFKDVLNVQAQLGVHDQTMGREDIPWIAKELYVNAIRDKDPRPAILLADECATMAIEFYETMARRGLVVM